MSKQSLTPTCITHFSPCASLAALGSKIQQLDLLEEIHQRVKICQKTVKDRPSDKLTDILLTLLAGAHGISELNTRLRADAGLQQAWGRQRCSQQSVAQQTLDACTAENVEQLRQALKRQSGGAWNK